MNPTAANGRPCLPVTRSGDFVLDRSSGREGATLWTRMGNRLRCGLPHDGAGVPSATATYTVVSATVSVFRWPSQGSLPTGRSRFAPRSRPRRPVDSLRHPVHDLFSELGAPSRFGAGLEAEFCSRRIDRQRQVRRREANLIGRRKRFRSVVEATLIATGVRPILNSGEPLLFPRFIDIDRCSCDSRRSAVACGEGETSG